MVEIHSVDFKACMYRRKIDMDLRRVWNCKTKGYSEREPQMVDICALTASVKGPLSYMTYNCHFWGMD